MYNKIPKVLYQTYHIIGEKILMIYSCFERIYANYSAFFPDYDYVSMTPTFLKKRQKFSMFG